MPYASTNHCYCKHCKVLHVYVNSILLMVFPSPLQVPGHLDEGLCRLQLKTVEYLLSIYTIFH